jgi:hypothetical protein
MFRLADERSRPHLHPRGHGTTVHFHFEGGNRDQLAGEVFGDRRRQSHRGAVRRQHDFRRERQSVGSDPVAFRHHVRRQGRDRPHTRPTPG